MFWSKIWFFLIAVLAAVALTITLVLPRPAERQRIAEERQRIITACDVVSILLQANARSRIDLAGKIARADVDLGAILGPASLADEISPEAYKTARTVALQLMESTAGTKPSFIMLLDGRGRAVARAGMDEDVYGDTMAGYFLVDDALAGYLRDDLWVIGKNIYLVAGSPVINNGYAGAVIVGHLIDNTLAKQLGTQLGVNINFYAAGQAMAASDPAPVHKDILAAFARTSGADTPLADDCRTFEPIRVPVGGDEYTALIARLPGEAGQSGGFYAVFFKRPRAVGLMGTLSSVTQNDLSFANFPWLLVAGGFLLCVALGMGLMVLEADRPLRRLSSNAVQLAKAEIGRLDEERHRGKFGSIARSVNIFIDKLRREARGSQSDLSDLLGPVGPAGPGPSPLPAAGPGGFGPPVKPPPPSSFRFTDKNAAAEAPGSARPTPPLVPARERTPPPMPALRPRTSTVEFSIAETGPVESVSGASTMVAHPADRLRADLSSDDESLFRHVFEQFVALKHQCGESTTSLTYEKFATKLRNNKQSLMAKHGCQEVSFQVYVKDGKAALKATPIKS